MSRTTVVVFTSSPYVGLWNTTTLGSKESSRARITFWMFPPESVPARVETPGVRTSKSRTSSSARRTMTARWIRPCRQKGR